jgi:hypothetical protein
MRRSGYGPVVYNDKQLVGALKILLANHVVQSANASAYSDLNAKGK